jgi:hypothetical protein
MRPRNYYIFKNNLSNFKYWKRKIPDLHALWYDGISDIIFNLDHILKPNKLVIEESLLDNLRNKIDISSNDLIVESSNFPPFFTPSFPEDPLAIFPSNDTHVHLFKNILPELNNFTIYVSPLKQEAAADALKTLNIPFTNITKFSEISPNHSGLLIANDWGPVEQYLAMKFRRLKKPIICLQESIIHFGDYQHRLEWCDFPFVQSVYSLRNLERDVAFLTGNPRYEELVPSELPKLPMVLINCNFTYGIYESIREQWIDDIVATVKALDLDYLIIQHPRDKGDLSKYNVVSSDASRVHDFLRSSSILITRFSSLIHEALALGRPVIYYNPHLEKLGYDIPDDGIHLSRVTSKVELFNSLSTFKSKNCKEDKDSFFYQYGLQQNGASDGQASKRVAQGLKIALTTNLRPKSRHYSSFRLFLRLQKVKWRQIQKRKGQ